MPVTLRAIRGATTLDGDTSEQIRSRTQDLISSMMKENEIDNEALVSIIFTVTSDITAMFPATAARELGLDDVALLGALEADIPGAPKLCIRVLMHCHTTKAKDQLRHVYLEGAAGLRPDLGQ